MSKTLYLECTFGISGDMFVGSLLDLGADEKKLEQALASLPVKGFHTCISRVKKSGLDACDFAVLLDEQHENHDHDMEYLHGAYTKEHRNETKEQTQEAGHAYKHEHRNLKQICEIIEAADMSENAKQIAERIFTVLAEAEAKVHGESMEQVHFHEVGAVDSIVDIVAAAVCLDSLQVEEVIVPMLSEGQGTVCCQHGILPIPVPAVTQIIRTYGIAIHRLQVEGELVTPTGAAIAAALRTQDHLPEDYQLLKIGLGAGKKDFPKANVLRAMLLETKDQPQTGEEEDIWKLESNIDDCSGEVLGYTMERLLAAGARDVCYAPIYMKKNRPAYMLHVLCDRRQIPAMEEIIFNETTTIGIRRYKVERTILKRHEAKAKTAYGEVELKICEKNGIVYRYPEYESVKKLCEAAGVPFKVVYQAACEAEISE